MRSLFFIIFTFFTLTIGVSQSDLYYHSISIEEGLQSKTVYDIYQAKDGCIIIGHEKGLSRFNGVNFENYFIENGNFALSNIFEIGNGNFYCKNFIGDTYKLTNNKLVLDKTIPHPSINYHTFLVKSKNVYYYDAKKVVLLFENDVFLNKLIYESPNVNVLRLDLDKDNLIINSNLEKEKLFIYNLKSKSIIDDKLLEEHEKLFFVDVIGKKYAFSPQNASLTQIYSAKIEKETFLLEHYDKDSKFTFIYYTSNDFLVIGTFSGIYVYDKNFKFIGNYLKEYQTSCILEDVEKNLWIGTLQDGILKIPSLLIKQLDLSSQFNKNIKISNSIQTNKHLIIGTFTGKLYWINENGNIEKEVEFDTKSEIQGLYFNPLKNILYCYCGGFFYEIDCDSGKIVYKQDFSATKDIILNGEKIYIASSNGLYSIDENKKNHKYCDSLWIKKIEMVEDVLYLETKRGLKKFNLKSQIVENVNFDENIKIIPNSIQSYQDKLYFFNANIIYSFKDGVLKSEIVYPNNFLLQKFKINNHQILAYNGDKILIHSDTSNKNTYVLNNSKGLMKDEIISIHLMKEKYIFVSNSKIQFFEKLKEINTTKPTIKLTDISGTFVDNQKFWTSSFENNSLHLKFEVLPNQSSLGKNDIYYKIDGLEAPNWKRIRADEKYELILERIPFGNYTLYAITVNEDGIYSEPFSMKLFIEKPYYLKTSFLSILVILFLLIVFFIVKWRINVIKNKNFTRLEREKYKIKALNAELLAIRSQMNPHFIFNSLSSIQSKILKQENEKAYENLSYFAKLLRQALSYTSKEFISLSDEIDFTKNYIILEQMRMEKAFVFNCEIDENLKINSILFPSLMLQPFIENSIRHGLMHSKESQKILSLKMMKNHEGYEIIIDDNGVGRKMSAEINSQKNINHESFATKSIFDRIEMINLDGKMNIYLEIIDKEKGTQVVIKVKLNK